MAEEGRAPARILRQLKGMVSIGATFEDILAINAGGGETDKLRFEIRRDRIMTRCAQGHSVGSGVRPDCVPVAENIP